MCIRDSNDSFLTRPIPKVLSVTVDLEEAIQPCCMLLVDTYKTCPEEWGRVEETTAFYLPIKFERNLTEEEVISFFKADDDAKGIFLHEVTDVTLGHPDFYYKHHLEIYKDAVGMLMRSSSILVSSR
jgi:hypothetical protein